MRNLWSGSSRGIERKREGGERDKRERGRERESYFLLSIRIHKSLNGVSRALACFLVSLSSWSIHGLHIKEYQYKLHSTCIQVHSCNYYSSSKVDYQNWVISVYNGYTFYWGPWVAIYFQLTGSNVFSLFSFFLTFFFSFPLTYNIQQSQNIIHSTCIK